jgi:hypothetical protein
MNFILYPKVEWKSYNRKPLFISSIQPMERPAPRQLQQVSKLATRKTVITWMVQDESINGNAGLYVRTIQAFPEHFRGKKIVNFVRATRWWARRNKFCNEDENANSTAAFSCTRSHLGQQKRMRMKATLGRGTKRSEWVM